MNLLYPAVIYRHSTKSIFDKLAAVQGCPAPTFVRLIPPVGVAVVLALGAFALGEVAWLVDAGGAAGVRVAGVAAKA